MMICNDLLQHTRHRIGQGLSCHRRTLHLVTLLQPWDTQGLAEYSWPEEWTYTITKTSGSPKLRGPGYLPCSSKNNKTKNRKYAWLKKQFRDTQLLTYSLTTKDLEQSFTLADRYKTRHVFDLFQDCCKDWSLKWVIILMIVYKMWYNYIYLS